MECEVVSILHGLYTWPGFNIFEYEYIIKI